jgi:hypothetical protein
MSAVVRLDVCSCNHSLLKSAQSVQQRNCFLFFEQVFLGGFAAILAERLCLSAASERLCGYAAEAEPQ